MSYQHWKWSKQFFSFVITINSGHGTMIIFISVMVNQQPILKKKYIIHSNFAENYCRRLLPLPNAWNSSLLLSDLYKKVLGDHLNVWPCSNHDIFGELRRVFESQSDRLIWFNPLSIIAFIKDFRRAYYLFFKFSTK